MKWLEGFETEERRVLLFAHFYQKTRRRHGQFGYDIFGSLKFRPVVLKTRRFSELRTIVSWLMENGWKVTWAEFHWQGYVEFAFQWMKPTIPMPGQLRNKRLLGEYIKSQPTNVEARAPARYSWEELKALYTRKLRPEIRNRGALMAALNLRQFQS